MFDKAVNAERCCFFFSLLVLVGPAFAAPDHTISSAWDTDRKPSQSKGCYSTPEVKQVADARPVIAEEAMRWSALASAQHKAFNGKLLQQEPLPKKGNIPSWVRGRGGKKRGPVWHT